MGKKSKHRRAGSGVAAVPDKYALYEAAVQNVEADLDFIEETFSELRGGAARTLKEDFCGTASLAARFAARGPDHRAWGIDLDPEPLAWGREHRIGALDEDARSRVELLQQDVREPLGVGVGVDVVVAFNFSYWIFTTRDQLRGYFRSAFECLRPGGLLFLDAFGGTESIRELEEETAVDASTDPDGTELPAFVYQWDQETFNPIDHRMDCRIHFRVGRGKRRVELRDAFTYSWRFWMLPELCELLVEAGFERPRVYVEGWDEEADEPDGVFVLEEEFDNDGGWIAYLVAERN